MSAGMETGDSGVGGRPCAEAGRNNMAGEEAVHHMSGGGVGRVQ